MDRRAFIGLLTVLPMMRAHADAVGYGGTRDLEVGSGPLKFHHHHNWDSQDVPRLFLDLQHHEKFLTPENDFAFVQVTSESGIVFRSPSPALTSLWISSDARFFVGLSNIMLYNPYQLIVWRANGSVMHREHISDSVAKISLEQRREFASLFPEAEKFLASRYFQYNKTQYLDFAILGVPNVIGRPAWDFLQRLSTRHPYSSDMSSSVTNWVFWFDESRPEVALDDSEHVYQLSLRSRSGSRLSVPLQDRAPG